MSKRIVVTNPPPHAGGRETPKFSKKSLPKHVAIVMDGNGRWANLRGLPRVEGHKAGERALLDVVAGGVEIGLECLSVYAFSTENWRRSPDEVRFLMGISRDIAKKYRHIMHSWGVRIRWSGRRPKLWKSVIKELEAAEELTKNNTGCVLNLCVNYGGRAEIVDAVSKIVKEVSVGALKPASIKEKTLQKYLDEPDLPDVDLFLRTSGEQRISNFLLWQSAYAELVFMDILWPDVDRFVLFEALEIYANRERRYGGATDKRK